MMRISFGSTGLALAAALGLGVLGGCNGDTWDDTPTPTDTQTQPVQPQPTTPPPAQQQDTMGYPDTQQPGATDPMGQPGDPGQADPMGQPGTGTGDDFGQPGQPDQGMDGGMGGANDAGGTGAGY
jgi:hypothetical protein